MWVISIKEKALGLLKKYYGYTSFRDGQYEIIESILNGKETIGIMPTGGGKSICYQIPALIFEGLTIIISPLISLMKDQVDSLNSINVPSTYINSSLTVKQLNIELRNIINMEYKIIYIAPERLHSDIFMSAIQKVKISFVAIDEAHCISQWGHDFRRSYLEIPLFLKKLSKTPIQAAFTATATPEVKEDIAKKMNFKNHNEFLNGFDRKNLTFSVVKGENNKKFIKKYIKSNYDKSGIIYASTRKEVEKIHDLLNDAGYKVGKYHAGMTEKQRRESQEKFIYDDISIIVATNAFGMGIDKSNVRFVIHNNIPKDIESYYQEAGRAGRDGQDSECILIFSPKDIMTQRFFIENNQFEASEEIIEIKYKKLNFIVNYCHTSLCLRKYLLEYFGEEGAKETCDNCSNCLDNSDVVDITLETQKIISCVGRLKGMYGLKMISDILGGSKNKRILQNKLNLIKTYGILSDYANKDIKELINLLIGDGYLLLTTGEYPVLRITEKAYDFIKNKETLHRKILKVERVYEENNDLLEKLKSLRLVIAKEERVAPYIIFSDKTLVEMIKYLPDSTSEMLKIKGVGEVKADKYAERFIEIIAEYKEENVENLEAKEKSVKINKKSKTPSYLLTYEMYSDGETIKTISEQRSITAQTVVSHILESAENGKKVNFDDFFNEEEEKIILKKIEEIGDLKLTAIKKDLPNNITYDKIKAVICKNITMKDVN